MIDYKKYQLGGGIFQYKHVKDKKPDEEKST